VNERTFYNLKGHCQITANEIWNMTPAPYQVNSWAAHLKILIDLGHYEMLKAIRSELKTSLEDQKDV